MVYGLSTDPLQALKGLKQKGATTAPITPNFTTQKGATTPVVPAQATGLPTKIPQQQLAEMGGYGGGFAGITKPTIGTAFGAPAGAEQTAIVNMPQQVQQRIAQQVQPAQQNAEPVFSETVIQGQIQPTSATDLYADIKKGMPISQVSVLYPEYASQLAVINDLKIDIDKGMPETLIQQYYPELYAEAEAEATRGGGMKGAAAAMSPIDLGPTGETLINPIGRVAELIDNQIQKIGSFDFAKTATENVNQRVANLSADQLTKYQKERETYKAKHPILSKMYTKGVEGDNVLSQMWNVVTGNTVDRSEVDAFKDFVTQQETKLVEEIAGANTGGPHMGNLLANIPGSALKTASGIGRAVLNPADTLAGLGKLIFTEEGRQAIIDRYGSLDAFAKTLETDPIGVASDMLAVVEGGASIVSGAAKITGKIAARAGATGVAATAGKVASTVSEFGKTAGIASDLGIREIASTQIGNLAKATANIPVVGKIVRYGKAMTTPLDTMVDIAKPILGKLPTAAETLQRMNRVTAGDQRKFLKENGMPIGEFINQEHGAVGPVEAVEKSAERVRQNMANVDKATDTIKGPQKYKATEITTKDGEVISYKSDAVMDMANDALGFAERTGDPRVDTIRTIQEKYAKGQATLTDINKLQRYYQRNVQLGYYKDITAGEKVARSRNIDTAVREWKMKVAEANGFPEFREINLNTKAHMAIVKGLEKRDAGQQGNNAVSLTDWIMVAPAMIDPTHLAGLVTKKILQSNWFTKNYVKIVNKLNKHQIVAQKAADIAYISKIQDEKEFNRWLMEQETENLLKPALPSPETASPSNMGTPRNPIVAQGPVGETITPEGRVRNTMGRNDAPQVGDETRLGKVTEVSHTGGGFPKHSVKIEGYDQFMKAEDVGDIHAPVSEKPVSIDPREEAPEAPKPVDELAKFGDKRNYYAQSLVEELGYDSIDAIEDIAIRNEVARIVRMKDADKMEAAVKDLKDEIDEKKLDEYLAAEEEALAIKPIDDSSDISSMRSDVSDNNVGQRGQETPKTNETTTPSPRQSEEGTKGVEAPIPRKDEVRARDQANMDKYGTNRPTANDIAAYERNNAPKVEPKPLPTKGEVTPKVTSKSKVGDDTQSVSIDKGEITVVNRSGRTKVGEYKLSVSERKNLEKGIGNPNSAKFRYIEKKFKEAFPGNFYDFDRMADNNQHNINQRLIDAQISSINDAMKKLDQLQPQKTGIIEKKEYNSGEYKYVMTQRQPSPGAQPSGMKGFIDTQHNGRKAYELTYDRELTPEEISNYELLPAKQPTNDGSKLQTKQGDNIGGSDEIVRVSLFDQESRTEPTTKGEDIGVQLKEGHTSDTTKPGDGSGTGLPVSKSKQGVINQDVIKTLEDKQFSTNIKDYTTEEIAKLKQYEGGGGVQKAEGDFSGSNDEFYTPDKIIKEMRYLAKKYGYKEGASMLEPAAGTGRMIHNKPMRVSKATGMEIDKTSGTIAKLLNQDADIKIGDFQDNFMDFTGTRPISEKEMNALPKYDVVIGNPPYKLRDTKQRRLGDLPKVDRFEDYFMIRGLDRLNDGGTMVVIVPSSFLDKPAYFAKALMGAKGELVDAYRLPNKAFPNTDVGTDILVFKKSTTGNSDLLSNGEFFKRNPAKILGEVGERTNRFGKLETFVKGSIDNINIIKDDISNRVNEASAKITAQDEANKGLPQKTMQEKYNELGPLTITNLVTGKKETIPTPKMEIPGQETPIKPEVATLISAGEPIKSEIINAPVTKPISGGLFDIPTESEAKSIARELIKPKTEKIVKLVTKGETITPEAKPVLTKVYNQELIDPETLNATLEYQAKTNVLGEVEGIDYTENPALLNHMEGKTFINYEYFSGDIFAKLDQLEIDRDSITPEQYEKQRAGLYARLPQQQTIENVQFNPLDNELMGTDTGEIHTVSEYIYDKETKRGRQEDKNVPLPMKTKFYSWLREEGMPSRPRVSANEIQGYIDGRNVDKDRAGIIKEDAKYYFNKFMKEGIPTDLQEKIILQHNKRNRSVVAVDTKQIPLVINHMSETFKGKPFKMIDLQVDGVLKAATKGTFIIAHGVGYGKTIEGLVATVHSMQKGQSKRPLFIVPGQTMEGWKTTIKELFPTYKINDLGTLDTKARAKLHKEFGTDKSKWIADNTITIMTHSAFENQLAFKTDTQQTIGAEFLDDMATDDMSQKQREAMSEKNEAVLGAAATTKVKSGSDFSMYDKERLREQYGKMESMNQDEFVKQFIDTDQTNNPLSKAKAQEMFSLKPMYMEDFGFDHMTIDEIHNFKNVFSKAKVEEGSKNMYGDVQGSTSKRGMKMAMATNYILNNNNGRGVLGLSATPFNNQAIEVYNLLNFVARSRLKKLGITNMNDFMTKFSDFQEQLVVRPSGTDVAYKSIQKNFTNLQDLQRLVNEFIDFKGDSPTIIKPELKKVTPKLQMSELQKQVQMEIEQRIDENKEKGDVIGGQQEARANVVSPYFTNRAGAAPTPAEFMKNSPKLDFFADIVNEKNRLGNKDGAIIFVPQGVAFHELLREGLSLRTGIPQSKIGIINGTAKYKPKMMDTAKKFNSGEYEILIGGDNINEGIDLQHKTAIMYDTLLGRNPTVTTQKTGRGWRQGNMRNYVQFITPLMENSVDSVMMQKMEEKQSRINDIFSAEGEVFSVEDIDPAEEKLALMTDPNKKAKIAVNIEGKKLMREAEMYKGEIAELERHKANLAAEHTIPSIMQSISQYEGRSYGEEMVKRYQKDIASIQGKADRSREKIKKNNINIDADLVLAREGLLDIEKKIRELGESTPARAKEYAIAQEAEIANRKDKQHYLDQINDIIKQTKVFGTMEEQKEFKQGLPQKK